MTFRWATTLLFLLAAPRAALAQERLEPRPAAEKPDRRVVELPHGSKAIESAVPQCAGACASSTWYGWQTMAVDGGAFTLLIVGLYARDRSEGPLMVAGATAYLVGGPSIHFAHHNVPRGVASVGVRIGAPFLGAAIGISLADCSSHGEDACLTVGSLLGFGAGMLSAAVIDGALLAYDEPPSHEVPSSVRVAPTVIVDAKHATLGVAGTF
jgi:hypothetical protein